MKLDLYKIKKLVKEIGIKKLVIILFMGMLLMIIGSPTENVNNRDKNERSDQLDRKEINENYTNEQEKELENILSTVNGVESVKVMITLKSSREEVVLKDSPYSKEENQDENTYSNEEETVIVEDNDGNAYPYVIKEINPEIEGIVVAIKSEDEDIGREIIDVVLALFDIPVHKIKVMKMK